MHVNEIKTGSLAATEYSVFLLHAIPGKRYATSELAAMLQAVGFTSVTYRPVAADRSVVIAHKPG